MSGAAALPLNVSRSVNLLYRPVRPFIPQLAGQALPSDSTFIGQTMPGLGTQRCLEPRTLYSCLDSAPIVGWTRHRSLPGAPNSVWLPGFGIDRCLEPWTLYSSKILTWILFVSMRSGIGFNPSASAITYHRQSAKDIDPYFKSQLYVEDPVHQKPVLILRNGPSTCCKTNFLKINSLVHSCISIRIFFTIVPCIERSWLLCHVTTAKQLLIYLFIYLKTLHEHCIYSEQ